MHADDTDITVKAESDIRNVFALPHRYCKASGTIMYRGQLENKW